MEKRDLIFFLTKCLVLIFGLTSCRNVKYVPLESVKTEVYDKERTDSIVLKEVVNVRDSVVKRDSVVYTYNDKGDLLRSEIWHWKEQYSDANSLCKELVAKYDSLYTMRQDSIPIPYPVEKNLTKWEKLKMELGGWAFVGFILVILIGGWVVVRLKRK